MVNGETEAQLIEKTREGGRAFLKRRPGAFGGGIDPQSGIRFEAGQRVSVRAPGEKELTQSETAKALERSKIAGKTIAEFKSSE